MVNAGIHTLLNAKKGFIILLFCAHVCAVSTSAEDVSPVDPDSFESLTVEDYLEYGTTSNPGLKAAYQRWDAASQSPDQARSLPDPVISLGYFFQSVETRLGPQRARIGLMQMIPWFGKRDLRGKIAETMSQRAHAALEAERRGLVFRIKRAFWEYWFLHRSIEIVAESRDLIAAFEAVARTKYGSGTVPFTAVSRAQVELGLIENRLASLLDRRSSASASLREAIGVPGSVLLPAPAPEWPVEPRTIPSEESLSPFLIATNPELEAVRQEIRSAELKSSLARKEYFPDIGIGLDYVITGMPQSQAVNDAGKDAVIGMVTVTVPIHLNRRKAAVRQADAEHEGTIFARQNEELQLRRLLAEAVQGARDAKRRVALYRDVILPTAERSLGALRTAYEGDQAVFSDLIEAERIVQDSRLEMARAAADLALGMASLEQLTGTESLVLLQDRDE